MASDEPLLHVEGLRTWFPIKQGVLRRTTGWVQAVTDVDLDVRAGETVALVGESGCGKTTVGRSILRLVEPQAGRIGFEGEDLRSLSAKELRARRQRLQVIFQDPMASLNPRMRVRDLVAEGMRSFGLARDEATLTRKVSEALERVQLDPEQMWSYAHEFSGGQR